MFTQIVYSSYATRALDEGELAEILASSVKGNARRDITGLLLYTKGTFLQWSMGFRRMQEGDAAALPNFAPFFEDGFDPEKIKAKSGLCLRILKALAALPSTDPD